VNQKEIEQDLLDHILNKKIVDIELYNVNDSYFVFDPEATLVIDGGLQIKFEDTSFCLAWDSEHECFNYSIDSNISKLLNELNFYSIDAKQIDGIHRLVGKTIEKIEFVWSYFDELPWDGNYDDKRNFVPIEMLIYLSDNRFLQIALIDFIISEKPYEIQNPTFSLNNEMLVNLYSRMDIQYANSEKEID